MNKLLLQNFAQKAKSELSIYDYNLDFFIRLLMIKYLKVNNLINEIKETDYMNICNFKEVFIYYNNQINSFLKNYPFIIPNDKLDEIIDNLLIDNSFLNILLGNTLDEEFKDHIQVIGWIYQFYVSDNRVKFRQEKEFNENHIPTLSQVFTPKWICEYMVDNSLGRLINDSFSEMNIDSDLNYFINSYNNKFIIEDIRKLKVIEPCCGTGNILVYIYDVLYKVYIKKGYDEKLIPNYIISNIYGLDIDNKAVEICIFSLLVHSFEINKYNIYNEFNQNIFEYLCSLNEPNIFEIKDTNDINIYKIIKDERKLNFTTEAINISEYIINLFKNAKIIGSLMKVEKRDYQYLLQKLNHYKNKDFDKLCYLCKLAIILSNKYDCMITNPPYLGLEKLSSAFKEYALKNYPDSKSDMFAMFMETDFVKENGYMAMINIHSWMFISSYQRLREKFIENKHLVNMVHTGAYTFEGLSDTALATTFIYQNTKQNDLDSIFVRLADIHNFENKKDYFFEKSNYYQMNTKKFLLVSGNPYIYFVCPRIIDLYQNCLKLGDVYPIKQGLATGDNETFVRYWHEVDKEKIMFNASSIDEAINSGKKWFPYNKGGNYRKWYGMNEYIISFDNDSYQKLLNQGNKLPSRIYYFKEGITWSLFGFENFGVRYKQKGFVFDVSGSSMFPDEKHLYYALAFLTSNVAFKLLSYLAPTVNFQVGNIKDLPYIIDDTYLDEINSLVKSNIKLCQENWDNKETSWDYKINPLITKGLIENSYFDYEQKILKTYNQLNENEERINEIFVKIYNLKGIINTSVCDRDMSIKKPILVNEIKGLISYLVGVCFGRYKTKLNNRLDIQDVFSICDSSKINNRNYDNDLVIRIISLIKSIFGNEYYEQNITFISYGLTGNQCESAEEAEEILRKYLFTGFYVDHLRLYQKRPIYFLVDGGKKKGLKILFYIHNYNINTLCKIKKNIQNNISNKELVKKIDYLITKQIEMNLDDGIKVNHEKLKTILSPIK